MKTILSFLVLTLLFKNAMAQQEIIRKELLSAEIGKRIISKVDVREISFEPLQRTGRHKHPCPVFGYIAEGQILFQVEGQPLQILKAGEAFYEPVDTPIAHFDNISDKYPAKFIAYYLLNGEKELIEMLPEK